MKPFSAVDHSGRVISFKCAFLIIWLCFAQGPHIKTDDIRLIKGIGLFLLQFRLLFYLQNKLLLEIDTTARSRML